MTPTLILSDNHHVTGGERPAPLCGGHSYYAQEPCYDCDMAAEADRSPRIWWWPVDSEAFDLIDVGIYDGPLPIVTVDPHGNALLVTEAGPDEFRAVAPTEPCDTCKGTTQSSALGQAVARAARDPYVAAGLSPHLKQRLRNGDCPDCVDGKRSVQLVRPAECDCDWDQSDDCLIAEEADRIGGSYCDVLTDGEGHGTVPVARVTITLALVVSPDEADQHEASYSGPECVVAAPGSTRCLYQPAWDGALEYEDCVELPFKVKPGKTWVLRAEEAA